MSKVRWSQTNNVAMARAVQEAAKSKFRGQKVLKSKVVSHYPDNVAREYTRVVNAYMAMFNKVLKEYMPVIRKAIDADRDDMRHDASPGVAAVIAFVINCINADFEKRAATFGLGRKLAKIAKLNRKLTISEWKRVVHRTLGLSINEDYYLGEFYREMMKVWTQDNVDLITSIPKNTLADMRTIVEEGYQSGKSNTVIGKEIQETYGTNREHAQFIARDQTAKLNADMAKSQQQDAGVEEYVWSDSGDGRVRDCHSAFDGKRFKWSDPPMNWYNTKSRGRVYTECAHPGQAPACRCVALPVFNLPGLSLPWIKEAE